MFPVRVAWSATDKRGLHSPGLRPEQTNKPIIQQLGSPYCLILTLLVSKQAVRPPTRRLITFSLHCCSDQTWTPPLTPYTHIHTHAHTVTLHNPQCNSGTLVFLSSPDARKLKRLPSFREKCHLRIERALKSWGCHFLLDI